MTGFWAISAVLMLLAVGFAIWPLLQREADPFVSRARLLRDQIATLAQLEADGLLDPGTATPKRDALKAELLQLLEPSGKPQANKPALGALLALALALPLLTVILYQHFGTPNALLFTASSSAPTGATSAATAAEPGAAPSQTGPDLRVAAEGLEKRLSDRPEDAEGWTLLARTWQELGEFGKASEAYAKVFALTPDDPDLMIDYAQALGLAGNPRSLLGKPRELLQAALKLQPRHQRGLWLYGFAQRQAGELEGALQTWDQLIGQLPPGSQEAASLTSQINTVRVELGRDPLPMPEVAASTEAPPDMGADTPTQTTSTAPASATAAASDGSGLNVTVELDPALAARLAPSDVLYVFAKAESGPPMPLAIQRVPAGQLPFTVRLDDSMAMTPALRLSQFPNVIVGARVSKSGNAQAGSGDLQGFSAAIQQPHAEQIKVLISEVVP